MIPVLELGSIIWRSVRGAFLSSFGIIAVFAIVGTALSAVAEWGIVSAVSSMNEYMGELVQQLDSYTFDGDIWALVYDLFSLDFLITSFTAFCDFFLLLLGLFPLILSVSLGVGVSAVGWRAWRQMTSDFFNGK